MARKPGSTKKVALGPTKKVTPRPTKKVTPRPTKKVTPGLKKKVAPALILAGRLKLRDQRDQVERHKKEMAKLIGTIDDPEVLSNWSTLLPEGVFFNPHAPEQVRESILMNADLNALRDIRKHLKEYPNHNLPEGMNKEGAQEYRDRLDTLLEFFGSKATYDSCERMIKNADIYTLGDMRKRLGEYPNSNEPKGMHFGNVQVLRDVADVLLGFFDQNINDAMRDRVIEASNKVDLRLILDYLEKNRPNYMRKEEALEWKEEILEAMG